MPRIDLEFKGLEINLSQFEEKNLNKVLKKTMADIIADHNKKYAQGAAPDGKPQKKFKPSYIKQILGNRKTGKRVRVGGKGKTARVGAAKKRISQVPNLRVTGQFLRSRKTKETKDGISNTFIGTHTGDISNAFLGVALLKLGFRFHFLTKKNIKLAETRWNKEVEEMVNKAIK